LGGFHLVEQRQESLMERDLLGSRLLAVWNSLLMAFYPPSGRHDPAFGGGVVDAAAHHATGNEKRLLRALDLELLRVRIVLQLA
jgi:hypothetical protein